MGWLWSSPTIGNGSEPSNTSGAERSKKRDFGLTKEQRERIFGKNVPLQSADEARDAQADKELETFLNSLSESEPSKSTAALEKVARGASEEQITEQTNHDRILPDGSLNISPSALYPRTMSCRQAFDQAFYCQSLGGKFNDIYRFGHVQPCSEQWGAFWFCMRTRTLPAPERERQIRDYYAGREARKLKEFGSSEDVWEIRDKPVTKAFWKDPDADYEDEGSQLKE
jgi:hypothetical protein